MGLIVREGTAPIQDGETASGDEVEAEFNKIFNEINGNLSNVNISTTANIDGDKLANASIATAKIEDNAITTAKMAAAAVPKGYYATSTGTETFTTSTTFVDVPGITAATLTPGSTGDFIFCDLTFTAEATGDNQTTYAFGFNVNGQAATDVQGCYLWTNQWENGNFNSTTITWATVAPATTSMVIKPQYRVADGTWASTFVLSPSDPVAEDATVDITKSFRVLIVPTK